MLKTKLTYYKWMFLGLLVGLAALAGPTKRIEAVSVSAANSRSAKIPTGPILVYCTVATSILFGDDQVTQTAYTDGLPLDANEKWPDNSVLGYQYISFYGSAAGTCYIFRDRLK